MDLKHVPAEMVKIIPIFSGDARQLPLFIKKAEYILQNYRGNDVQNEYLFHVVTSRLAGEAANLVGERDHITTWSELKQLLGQHFGDPRTEDCLVLELESLKINKGESYLDFCHRVQQLRSILMAKINETILEENIRKAKQTIYTHTSLNVFLFNLPSYLVRLVRLKGVTNMEDALKAVLEEQNFQNVYNQKNNLQTYKTPGVNNFNNNPSHLPGQNTHQNQVPSGNNVPSSVIRKPPNFSNSFQSRNIGNNPNSSYNFHSHSPQVTRSLVPMHGQHAAVNAPRNMTPDASRLLSGTNTDVTLRTASSGRLNFTDNHGNYELQQNYEDNQFNSFSSSEPYWDNDLNSGLGHNYVENPSNNFKSQSANNSYQNSESEMENTTEFLTQSENIIENFHIRASSIT